MTNQQNNSKQSVDITRFEAVNILVNRGVTASYEYPGYIEILAVDGTQWHAGTANQCWEIAAFDDVTGTENMGVALEIPLDAGSEAIADAIGDFLAGEVR